MLGGAGLSLAAAFGGAKPRFVAVRGPFLPRCYIRPRPISITRHPSFSSHLLNQLLHCFDTKSSLSRCVGHHIHSGFLPKFTAQPTFQVIITGSFGHVPSRTNPTIQHLV